MNGSAAAVAAAVAAAGQRDVGGSLAVARWRGQRGGGAQHDGGGAQRDGGSAVAAARWLGQRESLTSAAACSGGGCSATARRWQAMDGARARATAIEGAGQEGGTTRGRREAMRQPAGREVPNRFDM